MMKRNCLPTADNCHTLSEKKHRVVLTSRDYEEALIHLRFEKVRRTFFVWTQRDGTLIPVCSMDWDHLCNTISMLERKKERLESLEMLEREVF